MVRVMFVGSRWVGDSMRLRNLVDEIEVVGWLLEFRETSAAGRDEVMAEGMLVPAGVIDEHRVVGGGGGRHLVSGRSGGYKCFWVASSSTVRGCERGRITVHCAAERLL